MNDQPRHMIKHISKKTTPGTSHNIITMLINFYFNLKKVLSEERWWEVRIEMIWWLQCSGLTLFSERWVPTKVAEGVWWRSRGQRPRPCTWQSKVNRDSRWPILGCLSSTDAIDPGKETKHVIDHYNGNYDKLKVMNSFGLQHLTLWYPLASRSHILKH